MGFVLGVVAAEAGEIAVIGHRPPIIIDAAGLRCLSAHNDTR